MKNRYLPAAVCFSVPLMLSVNSIVAQPITQRSITDSTTVPLVAGGTPTGSYPLSGFDTVNMFSGNLEVRLPLLKVGGRGEAGYTMALPIERRWNIVTNSQNGVVQSYLPWTSLGIDWSWSFDFTVPVFSPGALISRTSQSGSSQTCGTTADADATLMRLTFIGPDGSEIELVDQQTGGAAESPTPCSQGVNRGTIFVARDGSAATFISDIPLYDQIVYLGATQSSVSGILIFRNGVRYRIDNSLVSWIRDRNGNQVNLYYNQFSQLTAVIDSLNREILVNHFQNQIQIVFPGAAGTSSTISVNLGTTDQVCGCGTPETADLFGAYGSSGSAVQSVVTSVVLPNSTQYSFLYNNYSELTQVTLPTGGQIRYTHGPGDPNVTGQFSVEYNAGRPYVYRRVQTRDVYPDGVTREQHTVYTPSYSTGFVAPLGEQYALTSVTVDHYDIANHPLAHERHYFYGGPNNPDNYNLDINYAFWVDGKEYQTDELSADGSAALRSTTQAWQQRTCVSGETCLNSLALDYSNRNGSLSPVDPRLASTATSLDNGPSASQTYSYDQYNNKTDVYEYDYGGAFLRRIHNTYLVNGTIETNTGPHLPSLLQEQTAYDGPPPTGAMVSDTQYFYDIYNQTPLLSRSGMSGYTDPATLQRGNLTSVTEWLNPGAIYFTSSTLAYDVAGSVVSFKDANNNTTQFTYDDNFSTSTTLNSIPVQGQSAQQPPTPACYPSCHSYALPTQVTNALGQSVQTHYDYYLGKPTAFYDLNSVQTQFTYSPDPLDRPLSIVRGVGTSAQTQTAFSYCDTCRTVTTSSDLTNFQDGLVRTMVTYDGLGRKSLTQQYESSGSINVTQTYDGLGRIATQSNPYRPATETAQLTTYGYDGLSRRTSVASQDGSTTSTSYSGNQTTVTEPHSVADPVSAFRATITDAIGRIKQVTESGTYVTTYGYDALDDLTNVNQSGRARSFTYDSLKRLTAATNPEIGPQSATNGTINYTYDNNGNLHTRTDPRNVTTTLTYDALNRALSKSYNDGTPQVNYVYDSVSKGQLSSVTAVGVSSTTYDSYDPLGRVTHTTQNTSGFTPPYTFSYTYNRAGAVASETYPSQRVVTFSYDVAGRTTGVSGTFNGSTTNYASQIQYASMGAISQLSFGNGLLETRGYSVDRQQLISINAGSVLSLSYFYCANQLASCTTNNGNVFRQRIGSNLIQDYGYTEPTTGIKLNRLTSAVETGGSQPEWFQNYDHDVYGNHWVTAGTIPNVALTPTSSSNFDAKNRLQINNSGYDSAGNQKQIGGYTFTYDGENRQSGNTLNTSTTYKYDGAGQRVVKVSGGSTTVYVYDAMGGLAAEYASSPQPMLCQVTCYMTVDALGSTRLVTDEHGTPKAYHDYFPFGEEIPAGTGGRSSLYGAMDGITEKFTGKERDAETGLDYFGVRYMSSAQGRFTSPDPLLSSGRPWEPQSWNRYAYTLNNPLKYIDPNGLYEWSQKCGDNDQECQANRQQFRDALATIQTAAGKLDEGSDERNKLQAVLDKYGDEGEKNKVFIKFGAAGGFPADESTSLFGGKSTITFDMKMINNMFNTNESINPAYKASTGWGEIVAHEGAHMLDKFMFGNPVNRNGALRTEVNAFDTQSFVPKALNLQSQWGLWNPGWKEADRETMRKAAVQSEAQRDVDLNWGKKK